MRRKEWTQFPQITLNIILILGKQVKACRQCERTGSIEKQSCVLCFDRAYKSEGMSLQVSYKPSSLPGSLIRKDGCFSIEIRRLSPMDMTCAPYPRLQKKRKAEVKVTKALQRPGGGWANHKATAMIGLDVKQPHVLSKHPSLEASFNNSLLREGICRETRLSLVFQESA